MFVTEDGTAARLLVAEKEAFRQLEASAADIQLRARRTAPDHAAPVSVLHLDLLHDLKRINAHLVSAAAYPVLEAEGALLPTRLRDEASVA